MISVFDYKSSRCESNLFKFELIILNDLIITTYIYSRNPTPFCFCFRWLCRSVRLMKPKNLPTNPSMIDPFLQFFRHCEWNFSLCQTLNQSIEHFGDCRYFDCYTQPTFDSANTTPTKSRDKNT